MKENGMSKVAIDMEEVIKSGAMVAFMKDITKMIKRMGVDG